MVRLNGRYFDSTALVANTLTRSLSPALIPRLVSISDSFGLYRFTKLRVQILPSSATGSTTVCYYNQTVDVPPASHGAASECDYSVVMNAQMSIPQGFTVSRRDLLKTGAKWFKTKVSASVETWEEIQGSITAWGDDSTGSLRLVYHYEVEFCDPLATGSTPQMVTANPASAVRDLPTIGDFISKAVSDYYKLVESRRSVASPTLSS